ncbi:hypothetical protein [Peribacillus deserti]|uniref:hypothetical protein n=1 Tax=Peribacillus deserti TaxID=673318 RepID=UPI0015E0E36E|nr:hypothetical protein [Peribacillus deserti]
MEWCISSLVGFFDHTAGGSGENTLGTVEKIKLQLYTAGHSIEPKDRHEWIRRYQLNW